MMRCAACRHFVDDPSALERALPGLAVLSSALAASRAEDGLCRYHDRYVMAAARCGAFAAVQAPGQKEGRSSFLKKRSKKLLSVSGSVRYADLGWRLRANEKGVLVLFFK